MDGSGGLQGYSALWLQYLTTAGGTVSNVVEKIPKAGPIAG